MLISNVLYSFGSHYVDPDETSRLVALITDPFRYIGLSSYTKVYKLHWTAKLSIFCFFLSCVLQMITLFTAKNDPDKLFECFSVLSFCGMGVLKLHSLCKHHKGWLFLLTQISKLEDQQLQGTATSQHEYQSIDDDNINFSDYINVYTNKFKTASSILIKIYFFTCSLFIMSPFAEQILCKLVASMECVTYPHILPCWAPLDKLTFFGYLITVWCECLAAAFCVSVHLAFDLIAFGVMMFVCGQFSLLREYSSCIGGKGKKCNLSKKRDDRAHSRIKHCHDTNLVLVNSIAELNKLLVNIIGVYFFVATLTLCSVAVRLQTEVMGPMQLVSLIQYMCATLTQLFLFCRYGDAVMNESSVGMGQGPYAAATWCLSPHIRRDLAILAAEMMRPRHLRAGPFNNLDLPSFIQIIRTAYSYYAVLGKRGQ